MSVILFLAGTIGGGLLGNGIGTGNTLRVLAGLVLMLVFVLGWAVRIFGPSRHS